MINLKKFDKMAGLSFQNCIRLHFDAIYLFDIESYPTSFFLSVLSLEEYGKIFNILDVIYHSIVHWDSDAKMAEGWLQSIFSHSYKQRRFGRENSSYLPKKYSETIYNGKLEIEKQNAIYVGLPKTKSKFDIKGKIINPLNISRNKVKSQITIMNDCLLEITLGNMKGLYFFESDSFSILMNQNLYKDLLSRWKYRSRKTQKKLIDLEKLEDEID